MKDILNLGKQQPAPRRPALSIKPNVIITVLLLAVSGFFFYLHIQKQSTPAPSPKDIAYWRADLSEDKHLINFTCKAGTPYTFKSEHGFSDILINGKSFKRRRDISYSRTQYISFWFPYETELLINCFTDGMFFKTGELEIWRDRQEGLKLYYLTTDKYLELTQVTPGDVLTVYRQNEPMYVVWARGGKKIKEALVTARGNYKHLFRENYDILLRSAEISFLAKKEYKKTREYCKLGDTIIDSVIFLDKGDTHEFKLWLEKKDTFQFKKLLREKPKQKALTAFVGIQKARFMYGAFHPSAAGYLKVKAHQKIAIREIKVNRNQSWKLNIKENAAKRIKTYSGDVFKIKCMSRYYINDKLMDSGTTYYKSRQDGYLAFRSSVDPQTIYVWVKKRRGF